MKLMNIEDGEKKDTNLMLIFTILLRFVIRTKLLQRLETLNPKRKRMLDICCPELQLGSLGSGV